MNPNYAKHNCRGFLVTLQRLANEKSPAVADIVRNLIQSLIDGDDDPETFTAKLQCKLNSPTQPSLALFLKRSLPYLQNSLLFGEISIDGVLPPPRTPRGYWTLPPDRKPGKRSPMGPRRVANR